MLAAYSATKSAAWSFTNALRIEMREKGTQVLALHVGFLDTDMTKGFNMKKNDPQQVAAHARRARERRRRGAGRCGNECNQAQPVDGASVLYEPAGPRLRL
jgi:short-subunit dehydrogenase